jgi:hypothetical protein
MKLTPALPLAAMLALAACAPPPPPSPPAAGAPQPAAEPRRRVELPGERGQALPYTVEIPQSWEVQQAKGEAGLLLLAPPHTDLAKPDQEPRAIYVRPSPVSLADLAAVMANIRLASEQDKSWTAPVLEPREVAGVRGLLVQMDSGVGEKAHSTLVLKLPYDQKSLDFMATAPRAEFGRYLRDYQRILDSVRPRQSLP